MSLHLGAITVVAVVALVYCMYSGGIRSTLDPGAPGVAGASVAPGAKPGPDLASELNFRGTNNDISRMLDYSEVTKLMGLEPDVARSHSRFVNELPHRTTTASHESVLTSFNPPVQFHGLPRNALYKQAGASSNSRTVPTETDMQSIDYSLHRTRSYAI
jgi:hypothetical protein